MIFSLRVFKRGKVLIFLHIFFLVDKSAYVKSKTSFFHAKNIRHIKINVYSHELLPPFSEEGYQISQMAELFFFCHEHRSYLQRNDYTISLHFADS
ncbi:UNVERIFIED_CONTAM: hypothetical protein NCL1_53845 [Trichonephila clavipes]